MDTIAHYLPATLKSLLILATGGMALRHIEPMTMFAHGTIILTFVAIGLVWRQAGKARKGP